MDNAIEVKGLSKRYDTFALSDVTFNVPSGYIMGFVGPNGAGKTTTLKSILNMINTQSGDINIFGQNIKDPMTSVNQDIGIIMDQHMFVEDWKVLDVEKAVAPYYKNWDGLRFNALLKQYQLAKQQKVKRLSRGMKVKLMLAIALSHHAKLLILDEPTSGLDPLARDELCELLLDFIEDEDHSVIFSTHITADLERIADYITFILNGKIIYTGTKDKLLESFYTIKGDYACIDDKQESLIYGIRNHQHGFEGLIDATNQKLFNDKCLIEEATIDNIIVFMTKGRINNEASS